MGTTDVGDSGMVEKKLWACLKNFHSCAPGLLFKFKPRFFSDASHSSYPEETEGLAGNSRDSTVEEPAEEPWLKLIIHLSPSLLSLRKGGFCLMLTQY